MLGRTGGRNGGRWHRCALAAATALVVFAVTGTAQASSRDGLAPLHMARSAGIKHRYIVVLKGRLPRHPTKRSERKARAQDKKVASSVNARPRFLYDADIRGFAARLTHTQVRHLRHHPKVKYVEQDEHVKEVDTQRGATWGLVRIDQRSLNLDGIYNYSSTAGHGVHVYIIDTGIKTDSVDFGSRASFAANFVDRINADENGHGTHVAGTVAGTKYGVAKRAALVGVKVLNKQGSGTTAGVIQGINWVEKQVAEHHSADKAVANMSLGGGLSTAMNDAVKRLVESGVFVSVAAGNDNRNACNYSPAAAPTAFTVAASDNTDKKATFSNYGPCVDAYAPGVAITSDWIGSAAATNTISGTSMAAPHVAGVAALYLSEHVGTPAGTTTWILDHATPNVITGGGVADTPNLLLYKGGL
jgi:subtilisin family serine protease